MELFANDSNALLGFIGHACNNADSRKTGNKALDFVHLLSSNGELSISGSNGAQSFTRICQDQNVHASADGALCLDAVKLFQVVRTLPKDKPVKIKQMAGKDRVTVSCGRSRLQIKTLDVAEYPSIEMIGDQATSFEVKASVLNGLFTSTLYASAKNDVRVYLNAILLQVENNNLSVVASDGHRLTTNECTLESNVADTSLLLPVNAMSIFTRLSERSDTITVNYNDTRVEFNWGGLVYRTSLIEHKYPDVKRVIPTNSPSQVVVNRAELQETLKRLLVMISGEKSQRIKLIMENDHIHFKTCSEVDGEGVGEDFIAAEMSGQAVNFEYGLNPKYLEEAIGHIYSEKIVINFTAPTTSCCITSSESVLSKAVIMPVRI